MLSPEAGAAIRGPLIWRDTTRRDWIPRNGIRRARIRRDRETPRRVMGEGAPWRRSGIRFLEVPCWCVRLLALFNYESMLTDRTRVYHAANYIIRFRTQDG